jgi:hypothetical protein
MRTSTVSVLTDPAGTASPHETTVYLQLPVSSACSMSTYRSTIHSPRGRTIERLSVAVLFTRRARTHFRLDASAARDRRCLRAAQFDVRAQTFDRDQRLTVTPSNCRKRNSPPTNQIPLTYLLASVVSGCKEYLTVMGARHIYTSAIDANTFLFTVPRPSGSLTYLLAHGCNEYLTVMTAAIFPLPP